MSELSFIPLAIPNISSRDKELVNKALDDAWVSTAGPDVGKFEQDLASYVGSKYAVACASGTAAIHLALMVMGVKAGDEVLVPNLTFVATVNAVSYVGAVPVFMDSEWSTLGMDPVKVKRFFEEETEVQNGVRINKGSGNRVAAIMPMHTLGHPVELDKLIEVSEQFSVPIIEDAAESLGSTYKGKNVGLFGKLGCLSFNGNKIMTTGGGGAVVTDDEALAKKIKHISTTAKTDDINFDHDEVGYNYRMVNLLAALGVAQLERMPEFFEAKRSNFKYYQEQLKGLSWATLHSEQEHVQSNYWMYALVLNEDCKHNRDDIIKMLGSKKIQARPIWKLMNELEMFKKFQAYDCDNSKEMADRIICLPCSTGITKEEINRVVSELGNL